MISPAALRRNVIVAVPGVIVTGLAVQLLPVRDAEGVVSGLWLAVAVLGGLVALLFVLGVFLPLVTVLIVRKIPPRLLASPWMGGARLLVRVFGVEGVTR